MPAFATCVGLGCSCSVSTTATNFGIYNPIAIVSAQSNGIVTVTCSALVVSALVAYTVDLSTGSSGTYAQRTLQSGPTNLNYNLYTNSSHTLVWGDGTAGTNRISDGYTIDILAPIVRDYTVYGLIPAQQAVGTGTYQDSIMATVTF
tara:strand:+ start:57476 stop:57916 length:441 start_codon:yes stop_codon:yes gene_type:complete